MQTLVEFQELVGSPDIDVPEVDWSMLEEKLGLIFPADYQAWAESYPSVEIDGFLWVRHPSEFYLQVGREGIIQEFGGHDSNAPIDGERHFDGMGEVKDRELHRSFYPVEGGFLPWGSTENGDILMWRREGSPEQWKVVVMDGQGVYWQEFDYGFLEFLVRMLRKEIRSRVLPEDFPDEPAIRIHSGFETGWDGSQVASFRSTSRWDAYFAN